jgi:hypothetical protein
MMNISNPRIREPMGKEICALVKPRIKEEHARIWGMGEDGAPVSYP